MPQCHAPLGVSLVDALRDHAAHRPDKASLVFLSDGERASEHVSYGQLDARVRALAARLQAEGAAGQRVLLLLHTGVDYATAFMACLYAGAVPVPAYPPGSSLHAQRIVRIAQDCGAAIVLTHAALLFSLRKRLGEEAMAHVVWVAADEAAQADGAAWVAPAARAPDELALLQYTSGSTQDPRGVMVTHANLLHHAQALQARWDLSADDTWVTWVPLFHDMGLIGGLLMPLWLGATTVLMPAALVLQRPLRWLEAISRHRGSITFAPDFAFTLCAATGDAASVEALDLSSLRVACNAAEPVHAATLDRFAARFAGRGLRADALVPAYGLAEATLLVTAAAPRPAPRLVADAAALEAGRLQPVRAPGARALASVSCGTQLDDVQVLVVEPQERTVCAEGTVGEIWVAGPTMARGYWQRPEATAEVFGARLADGRGPFMRTGDLGAWVGDELHITGRLKDLIIVRGQNHYPSDIEHTALMADGALEPGRAAAFSVDTPQGEQLVLAVEVRRSQRKRFDGAGIAQRVAGALSELHGLQLDALLLLRPASLPITSSGKVQRRACRRAYGDNGLDVIFAWRAGPSEPVAQAQPQPASGRDALMDVLFRCTTQALRLDPARCNELRERFPTSTLSMLGLESLAALELCRLLQSECGFDLPLQDLLGPATAAQLVELLHARRLARELSAPAPASAELEEWTL